MKYAWVCVYGPVNTRNGKGREMKKFWIDVNKHLMEIGRGSRIVLIGYMKERVGSSEVAGVMGKFREVK